MATPPNDKHAATIPFRTPQPQFHRRGAQPSKRAPAAIRHPPSAIQRSRLYQPPPSPPPNLGSCTLAARAWWCAGASASEWRTTTRSTMLRAVRPRLGPAPSAGAAPRDEEARACYGIVVACVSLLLLCALVSAVGVVRAFAATGVLVLLLGLAGWLAPTDAFAVALDPAVSGNASGAGSARPPVRLQVRRCASCGLAAQAIDALPTFAYEPPAVAAEKDGGGGALCAVCLEDVEAGETVRRLPSCGHLFHVDCIDMWLHAHRTCPLCRRDLSPRKVTAKTSAAATTVSSTDVLPPV